MVGVCDAAGREEAVVLVVGVCVVGVGEEGGREEEVVLEEGGGVKGAEDGL